MVFAANVRLLMGNNMFQILRIHSERQIDSRLNDTKYKRRAYFLALVDIVFVSNSSI